MAKLRLFANLREIAGMSRLEVPADTVGDVIAAANQRFGDDFERGVETSRVWVNGEEAELADTVSEGDEVVLLPPVSGGAQPTSVAPADLMSFVPVLVAAVVVVASLQSQEIWAAALVAVAALWSVDLGAAFTARGRVFAPLAVTTSAAAGALSAHVLGGTGYGLAIPLAVAVVLGWAVAFADYRQVNVYSPTLLAGMLAGLGIASMLLASSGSSPDPRAVDVFLAAVIAAVILGSLVARMPNFPFFDPFSTTAIVAALGATGAAAFWDLDVVGYLLVGIGIAVALVAGNGLSSMFRTGTVSLTERPPGMFVSMDGIVLAAAVYYPLIRVIL